jgi:hypothetical protein
MNDYKKELKRVLSSSRRASKEVERFLESQKFKDYTKQNRSVNQKY